MSTEALIAILAPIVVVELALRILAIQDLWKRDDMPRNVQMSWIGAVAIINFAWAAYFLVGKQRRPPQ